MTKLNFGLDEYTFKARLWPALITLLPATPIFFSSLKTLSIWIASSASIAGTLGLAYLACELVRDLGKGKEEKLYEAWGGKPTSKALRFGNPKNNPALLQRRRANLNKLLKGFALPTQSQEIADPAGTDAKYDAAVAVLRERTRDKERFKLIFKELTSYGFRRNVWALKPFGLGILLASTLLIFLFPSFARASRPIGLALNAILALWWILVVRKDWVRLQADRYAECLLDSTETLEQ